ncbi:pyridoxamine 5'-phosphate oxidase family protein [Variovorax rhizosphaerae]|uniref:Pyridoxamine 5'-phosphate oxidase family protein n=1 Tax=Variovorax rhizosphaerae TaxID=1836200 RepID=A0ABU8WWJ4_9BURK
MANDDAHATLWKIIHDTKFGMLTHRHGDGHLHSQPLTTQNKAIEADSLLYFFVARDGDIARHVASDANVNVAYANVDDDDYVSVSGTATISEDQAKKEELFNTIAKAWFPGGATDPNLALLIVRITQAEYWKAKDSKVVQLVKMAASAVSGNSPADMTEHRKL